VGILDRNAGAARVQLAERGGAQGRMMVIAMAVTAFAPTLSG
jgi:hypothetical protein